MTTPASLRRSTNERNVDVTSMAVAANKSDDDTPQLKVVMFALSVLGGQGHASTPDACLANVSNSGRLR